MNRLTVFKIEKLFKEIERFFGILIPSLELENLPLFPGLVPVDLKRLRKRR
jgi:hypothetical protein